jgi:hypothetical protein
MMTNHLEAALNKDLQKKDPDFAQAVSDVQHAKLKEIHALPVAVRQHVASQFRNFAASIEESAQYLGPSPTDPVEWSPSPTGALPSNIRDYSDVVSDAANRLDPPKKGGRH